VKFHCLRDVLLPAAKHLKAATLAASAEAC
jgi:hypothetical protein